MAESDKQILYLFERPTEPVYIPKGDERIAFDVPGTYLRSRLQPVAGTILQHFSSDTDEKIFIKETDIPDDDLPMELDRDEQFSPLVPSHAKMATRLLEILLEMPTRDDFLSAAAYYRDRVNPKMFIYALSVAILHRPDTEGLDLPSLVQVFPDRFLDKQVIVKAKEEANLVPAGSRIPVETLHPMPNAVSELNPEQRMAYFREDIGTNLYHWHWHLAYPGHGPLRIVAKDRRGELFTYMHQQILARYNTDRLCMGLPRVVKLNNFREPIPEACFPQLDSQNSSRIWPSRPAGTTLKDVKRRTLTIPIEELENSRSRILEAVRAGAVVDADGNVLPLTEETGIDVIGNMVEASRLSPNTKFYGSLHNRGHLAIAYCHDPDNRYRQSFSVMGALSTSMRDPIFYRWHATLNELYLEHKDRLPPYNNEQLDYPGIEVTAIEVITPNELPNTLRTLWNQSHVDLSRGLDFSPKGPIFVNFIHLNHSEFVYNIAVQNRYNTAKQGTCRIFLGPKYDEYNQPFLLDYQRHFMIELDRFTVILEPGENTITRQSIDSTVTLPFDRVFYNLDKTIPRTSLLEFHFTGCGWPHYLLLPIGTTQGFPMDLFVMISNYDDDKVEGGAPTLGDAGSTCGVHKNKYPDARDMGFPFNRKPPIGVDTLSQFLTPNMRVNDVVIFHTSSLQPHPAPQISDNDLMPDQ